MMLEPNLSMNFTDCENNVISILATKINNNKKKMPIKKEFELEIN